MGFEMGPNKTKAHFIVSLFSLNPLFLLPQNLLNPRPGKTLKDDDVCEATMHRRNIRLRREYLYRKSLEGKERLIYEKKRKIKEALEGQFSLQI